ncbi:hypothetical protein L839_0034 [Mycobacterium avium MAV_120809_2495]|nr:hypothetical protein L839_0034 [Mycobacterium avium MAV_120809_2495]
MMAEKKARRGTSQREAVEKIREGETFVVNLPAWARSRFPARAAGLLRRAGRPGGAGAHRLAGGRGHRRGHLLASNHHNKILEELGRRWRRCEGQRAVTARHEPAGIGPSAMPCGCRWG